MKINLIDQFNSFDGFKQNYQIDRFNKNDRIKPIAVKPVNTGSVDRLI